MRQSFKTISVMAALCALAGSWLWRSPVWSDPISPPADRQDLGTQFIGYTLNPGTAIRLLLQTPLNTGMNQVGDPVEGMMDQTIYLGDEKVLPHSTRFTGVVSRLEPAMQGQNGILVVSFTRVLLENGETLPISAHVHTDNPDHSWGGEVTLGTKPMLSTQRVAGIGGYNRTVFGGPRAMGAQIDMKPGEHWTLILDQPLTLVKPREEGNDP
jgi:hypothetical protein